MNTEDLPRNSGATNVVRVIKIQKEADGVRSFLLESANGSPLPVPSPGSHIDIYLGPGLTRQYSLCNGPDETHRYLIAVKLDPESRGGSQRMHTLREGELLEISSPRNAFPLKPGNRRTLLLAGGIGITPLISMAKHLANSGHAFHLHYFARSSEAIAFRDALQSAVFAGNVTLHQGLDPGGVRRVLQDLLLPPEAGTELYYCGPAPFMKQAHDIVIGIWAESAAHSESFAAVETEGEREFVLSLSRSGKTVVVGSNERIIDAAARCGVKIDTSCEQGVCGTCIVRVVEGIPDHRDMILNEEERDSGAQICACVSRSQSPVLVIDV